MSPWSNIPKYKWNLMEKCTQDLKDQGKTGDSIYAICYSSIMGKLKKRFKNKVKK